MQNTCGVVTPQRERERERERIAGAECALASEEAVTGKQICQLPEATVGKVEHEVVCSPSGGSLVLGTKAASYYGTANIKLTNGWSWGAEP